MVKVEIVVLTLHKIVTDKMAVNLELPVKIHLIKVEDLIIKIVNLLTTIPKQQMVRIIKVVTLKVVTLKILTVDQIQITHPTRIKMVRVIRQHQMVNHKVTQMKMAIYQLNQEKVVKIKEVKMEVQLIQPVN